MKWPATGLEKIFVIHILDKRHVSTIYKQFSKLEKMKNLISKNARNSTTNTSWKKIHRQ